jgi:hypothetical protein
VQARAHLEHGEEAGGKVLEVLGTAISKQLGPDYCVYH